MTTRRSFIKSLALGTAALSSTDLLLAKQTIVPDKGQKENWVGEIQHSDVSFGNAYVKISGRLGFESGGAEWLLTDSRDAVKGRSALVDGSGNVQGYCRLVVEGSKAEVMFYHRSAQNFSGCMTLDAKVEFASDAFPCRTIPGKGERVLNLSSGPAFSLNDDSLFSTDSDLLLQMRSSNTRITAGGKPGEFRLVMSGKIDDAGEALFGFELKENYFRSRWVPYYKPLEKKGSHKVPTGWMSWNTYFDTATAEDNLMEARIGRKYLQPFGCEIWHIESWQANSDYLPVSKFHNMNLEVNLGQFPLGMKKLAEDIRALGFKPGIWVAPFGTGNEEFYNAHKDWFLHYEDGKPISCWNGKYTLDPTAPGALEHIESIFHTASYDWGYDYFKVDGMSGRNHGYCAHLYEREDIRKCFHDPRCTNPFERVVQAIRRGIGEEKYFLACQGHATGPEASYANASRLGADIVHPNKAVVWPGVKNQARCFLNQAYSHNIVMICDPDTLLVRDLPIEEARVSATLIALPGQLTFFGDKLKGLPEEKMKILQQTLPVSDVRPKSLYPYFDMLPVWNLCVDNGKMQPYNVVALFNWEDESRTITASYKELGIAPSEYVGFEFWTKTALRFCEGEDISAVVPPHSVRVIALHHRQEGLQWLGSDRHVSLCANEVEGLRSEGNALDMEVRIVGGFPMEIYFAADGRQPKVHCDGAKCKKSLDNGTLALTLSSSDDTVAHITIR